MAFAQFHPRLGVGFFSRFSLKFLLGLFALLLSWHFTSNTTFAASPNVSYGETVTYIESLTKNYAKPTLGDWSVFNDDEVRELHDHLKSLPKNSSDLKVDFDKVCMLLQPEPFVLFFVEDPQIHDAAGERRIYRVPIPQINSVDLFDGVTINSKGSLIDRMIIGNYMANVIHIDSLFLPIESRQEQQRLRNALFHLKYLYKRNFPIQQDPFDPTPF